MKRAEDKIVKHSFLLLAHYATFSYQDLLFEYLIENKAKRVTKINIPLPELPYLKQIEITDCEPGQNPRIKKVKSLYKPPVIAYILQSFQLLLIIIKSPKNYDIIIAENMLLAFLSIILRSVGKCKTVIFYSHGVDKTRFSLQLLNSMYQWLGKFSATRSDFNWFLNREFYKIRLNQGIPKNTLFWIPASIPIKTISRKRTVFNNKIVFLGIINKKNGAHIFINIVKTIKKKVPNIQLDVIGDGDFQEALKRQIYQNKLQKNIRLLGLKEFKDFAKILTKYTVGIAPYEDEFDTLTASSDSMKMRVYLAAGLPVVITKGFIFSEEIEKNNLGFSVPFTSEDFANAVIALLTQKEQTLEIRKRALKYSEDTDIHKLYDKTLQEIL